MAELPLEILQGLLRDLVMFTDGRMISDASLDTCIVLLEFGYHELIALDSEITTAPQLNLISVIGFLRNALSIARLICESRELTNSNHHLQLQVPLDHTGLVGRPCMLISLEQLSYLIENRFSVPQIAGMLGISIRTVRRRMTEFGLSITAQYSVLSDQELDEIVQMIRQQFPMCENKQMQGHLLSMDYHVQQHRVRDSQRRLDPHGSMLRQLHILNRRTYSVPAPLSLYHMDGHHKLIRCVYKSYVIGHKVCLLCRWKIGLRTFMYRWM